MIGINVAADYSKGVSGFVEPPMVRLEIPASCRVKILLASQGIKRIGMAASKFLEKRSQRPADRLRTVPMRAAISSTECSRRMIARCPSSLKSRTSLAVRARTER